jgi:hypothetical protein
VAEDLLYTLQDSRNPSIKRSNGIDNSSTPPLVFCYIRTIIGQLNDNLNG